MTKKQKEVYRKYTATGLYFVTSIRPKILKYKSKTTGEVRQGLSYKGKRPTCVRCCGWYKKLKDAIKVVEENVMDIHELDNMYVVIEKVPHGLTPMSEVEQWFVWVGDSEKGEYVKCDEPMWAQSICNWSIG